MAHPNPPLDYLALPKREMLFEQVSNAVSAQIHAGRWKTGEMLPNEIELAEEFQVSQGTMRRALKLLVDSGVLIRQQGRGTFVADFSNNEDMLYKRYIHLMPDFPQQEDLLPSSRELVTFEVIPSDEEVSRVLQVPVNTPVIHAIRLLNSKARLITYDEIWALESLFGKLTAHNIIHHKEKMLYSFYQNQCGVTVIRCEETFKAILMPQEICERFNLPTPLPVMQALRVAYTYHNKPVEYHRQWSLTDRYHYKVS